MGKYNDWVPVAPGTAISWRKKGEPGAAIPHEIYAIDPVGHQVLDGMGEVRPLHIQGHYTIFDVAPAYLSAEAGWFKLNCWWDKETETFESTWRPVIAWVIEKGGVERGVATDWLDEGIEYEDGYSLGHTVYWHIGEGEERKAELESVAEAANRQRMEWAAEAEAKREAKDKPED